MAYERKRTKKIIIRNTRFIYRTNFAGNPDLNYSQNDTSRNFNIVLDENNPDAQYGTCMDDMKPMKIDDLVADGWNIKWTKPDDDGNQTAFVNVTASYRRRGPQVIKAIGGPSTKIKVDEDDIGELDTDFIENVDYISINAYEWDPGKIKAYLKDMFVTVEDDPFMREYGADMADDAAMVDEDEDIPF